MQLRFWARARTNRKIKSYMKTFNSVKKLGLGLALTGLCAWQAGATLDYTAIDSTATSSTHVIGTGSTTISQEFTVSAGANNLSVGQLGAYDNGLAAWGANVTVSIYSGYGTLAQTLIAGVTFNSSTPGSQLAGDTTSAFRFLNPTTGAGATLVNGDTYALVVTGLGTAANKYYDSGSGFGNTTVTRITGAGDVNGDLTWAGSTKVGNSTISPTGANYSDHFKYGFGSFTFSEFAAVPEASGFAVAAVALLGLVYVGRSYSRKLKVA